MALVGSDVRFYFTIDDTLGTNQPDPNDSLGGNRAGNTIETVQSSLTVAMTNRFQFIDTTQIGSPPTLPAWVAFVEGINALQMRRIIAFDNGTGEFTVEQPFVGLGGIGDFFRYCELGHLFDAVDREEASGGIDTFRSIAVRNQTGVTINDAFYFWGFDSDDGGIPLDLGASGDIEFSAANTPVSANDRVVPDLQDLAFDGASTALFQRPHSRASSLEPNGGHPSWIDTRDNYLWIQRGTQALSRISEASAELLILTLSNTGGDPDPLTTCVPIVWESVGIVPEVIPAFDRKPRTFGGATVVTLCRDDFALVAIPDESIEHELTVGPGSLVIDPQRVTDEDGILRVVYLAPENDANAGDTVTVEARVT